MALQLAVASYIQHMCSVCDSVHILRYVYTLENKHGPSNGQFFRLPVDTTQLHLCEVSQNKHGVNLFNYAEDAEHL